VPGELRYRYQDVTTPATGRLLDGLLRRREFDVFCLNDGDGAPADHASRAALLKEFFERYYPVPAPWEKS
jgi:UDP-glucose 4-epimerase